MRYFGKLLKWLKRALLGLLLLFVLSLAAFRFFPVPITIYQALEWHRLGEIKHEWVPASDIAPVMLRSVVAAEDAKFCQHWGFDMEALRLAVEGGMRRGGSTISQQTAKNVYLFQGRNWGRKAAEALLTPLIELAWSKQRIVEVYLNVIEFDEGVFGVQAASQHYFGVTAAELSPVQAARLAAVLPNPKDRSASRPTAFLRKRAASIMDGAETIRRDGRADCFSG
ncbi:MAG: monofunctional biosynthetic peptidoglycan transglycosylase [Mangrovicoccus sp.]